MESAVPWSKIRNLIKRSEEQLYISCKARGFSPAKALFSSRITQIYETGATVYIYWGLNYMTDKVPLETVIPAIEQIEHEIREVMLECGGSLSHHHGVGKLKQHFFEKVFSPAHIKYLQLMKQQIDPKNIFGIQNTFYTNDQQMEDDKSGRKFGMEVSTYSPIQAKALADATASAKSKSA